MITKPDFDPAMNSFANNCMTYSTAAGVSRQHGGEANSEDVRNILMLAASVFKSCSSGELSKLFKLAGIDLRAMFGESAGNVADVLEHEHSEWRLTTPKSPGQASWKVKCTTCPEERHILKAK